MSYRCVILDFDGTFTDAHAEAAPFLDALRSAIADLLGAPIDEAWREHEAAVRAAPHRHGWRFSDAIVAPATADPYILATTVAQRLMDDKGVLRQPEHRATVMQALYHHAYRSSAVAFRPDAARVLEGVLDRGLPCFVITNASTDTVTAKLQTLSPRALSRVEVMGGAQKYWVGDPEDGPTAWGAVPRTLPLDGLPGRDVVLRRGRYLDALRRAFRAAGCEARDAIVCGDIFELDLALPRALGCAIHLVASESTPAHEILAVRATSDGRGTVGALSDLLARL